MDAKFIEYINSLELKNEAAYAMEFMRKFEHMQGIYSSRVKGSAHGFGNYNASIMLIFKDEPHYKEKQGSVEKIFNKFGYDVYKTYIAYESNNLIQEEIKTVKPAVIYSFTGNTVSNIALIDMGAIYVDVHDVSAHASPSVIFDKFKYVVTYGI